MINSTKQLPSWLLKHLMHACTRLKRGSSFPLMIPTHQLQTQVIMLSSNCGTESSSGSDIPDELDEGRLCIMAGYISVTCVLFPNPPVPKDTQLHLVLTEYHHGHPHRFHHNLHVSPPTFDALVNLIQNDAVFRNNSINEQMLVEFQLAVFLYHARHFGNSTSITSIAQWAGMSEGAVVKCTCCIQHSFMTLHDDAIHPPTNEQLADSPVMPGIMATAWWMGPLFHYLTNQVFMEKLTMIEKTTTPSTYSYFLGGIGDI